MRYASDIQLEQMIVHILDPKRKVLSERTLPLVGNDELRDFFADHIKNSLKHAQARAAKFKVLDSNLTSGICKGMIDGSVDFVQGSRNLADRLYDIITPDDRISAGDLVVCSYRANGMAGEQPFLALLKIDPSEVFRHAEMKDAEGKVYVGFELEKEVMPTTRERLQKCAFIRPLDPRPADYDMMLLDRQLRPTEELPVARFFRETFLGANMALDSKERTKRFYVALIDGQNQLQDELSEEAYDELGESIHQVMLQTNVNIDDWIEGQPLTDVQRETLDGIVSKDLPDREFAVDEDFAAKLVQKTRFRADFGVKFEVDSDFYDDVVQKIEKGPLDDQGKPKYHRIVIHATNWKKIK